MPGSEHVLQTIPEDPANPYRLGRKINHDPRSRSFAYQPRRIGEINTRDAWPTLLGILNQAKLGSCVPNTGVEWLGTMNFLRPALTTVMVPKSTTGDLSNVDSAEETAIELYRRVTAADPFMSQWEPDDTGSDGTSLGNLFVEYGWLDSFTHAFAGLIDVLSGLSADGPVWMGCNWYSSMFDVNSDGEVVITPGAWIAGGHQFLLTGKIDTERRRVEMRNHWRHDWGMNGCAWMSYDTITRLLGEDGDAQILKAKVDVVPPFPVTPVEPPGCLPQFLPASIRRRLDGTSRT
jgi:hypothetical protein